MIVSSEFVVELSCELAGVENPCKSLEEADGVVEDEDPEETLSSISGGINGLLIFLAYCDGLGLTISISGGEWSLWVGWIDSSDGSACEEEEEECSDLEEGEEGKEHVDEADSALEEADGLVLWEEDEDKVEDGPWVNKEESTNASTNWGIESNGEEEWEDGEYDVSDSVILWVSFFVENHLVSFF